MAEELPLTGTGLHGSSAPAGEDLEARAIGAGVGNPWWFSDASERYWMEISRRTDFGANLKTPQANELGEPYWGYSLVLLIQPGDTVFHWDQNSESLIGYSRAVGRPWSDDLVWAARGTSARNAGTAPHLRPGWYLGLEGFTQVGRISRAELTGRKEGLAEVRKAIERRVGKPSYFPFTLYSGGREPTPQQAYLTKFPKQLLEVFPELSGSSRPAVDHQDAGTSDTIAASPLSPGLGTAYRPADEVTSVAQRDPFAVDPALVERGLRSHAVTQNALAVHLQGRGIEPRSPSPSEPSFDLSWRTGHTVWVAEIKSLTPRNEERQLRLGLGQVLRYADLLRRRFAAVRPTLVLERPPRDPSWAILCQELGVVLTWPGDFDSHFHSR